MLYTNQIDLEEQSKFNGAGTRTRTADLMITNQLLYQLSYAGAKYLFILKSLMLQVHKVF